MDGLRIKNGRLINDRPDSEMGLVTAAKARRAMKSSHAVRDIAAGIELAEQQKEMREAMMASLKKMFK
jgi:hypothetical protein|tara:strand:+ start:836 stop:1039 length:204 start_codon:yes stop_codon:yes gene_type:complete